MAADAQTKGQVWQAASYGRHCRFVAELGAPVLELLAPRRGERILDLGCGDGALTQRLVEAGARVTAVDAAADMVAAARRAGLDAECRDATDLGYDGAFDAVFTNAVLHWVPQADAVIDNVWRALVPGGRFVGEFGGFANVAAIRVALHAVLARRGLDGPARDPWFFPSAGAYAARLEARGFRVQSCEIVPRPTLLTTDMAGWMENFSGAFLAGLEPAERERAVAEVLELLAPVLRDEAGQWWADYIRLRFAAEKPADAAAKGGAR